MTYLDGLIERNEIPEQSNEWTIEDVISLRAVLFANKPKTTRRVKKSRADIIADQQENIEVKKRPTLLEIKRKAKEIFALDDKKRIGIIERVYDMSESLAYALDGRQKQFLRGFPNYKVPDDFETLEQILNGEEHLREAFEKCLKDQRVIFKHEGSKRAIILDEVGITNVQKKLSTLIDSSLLEEERSKWEGWLTEVVDALKWKWHEFNRIKNLKDPDYQRAMFAMSRMKPNGSIPEGTPSFATLRDYYSIYVALRAVRPVKIERITTGAERPKPEEITKRAEELWNSGRGREERFITINKLAESDGKKLPTDLRDMASRHFAEYKIPEDFIILRAEISKINLARKDERFKKDVIRDESYLETFEDELDTLAEYCKVDSEVLEKINTLKKREGNKHYAYVNTIELSRKDWAAYEKNLKELEDTNLKGKLLPEDTSVLIDAIKKTVAREAGRNTSASLERPVHKVIAERANKIWKLKDANKLNVISEIADSTAGSLTPELSEVHLEYFRDYKVPEDFVILRSEIAKIELQGKAERYKNDVIRSEGLMDDLEERLDVLRIYCRADRDALKKIDAFYQRELVKHDEFNRVLKVGKEKGGAEYQTALDKLAATNANNRLEEDDTNILITHIERIYGRRKDEWARLRATDPGTPDDDEAARREAERLESIEKSRLNGQLGKEKKLQKTKVMTEPEIIAMEERLKKLTTESTSNDATFKADIDSQAKKVVEMARWKRAKFEASKTDLDKSIEEFKQVDPKDPLPADAIEGITHQDYKNLLDELLKLKTTPESKKLASNPRIEAQKAEYIKQYSDVRGLWALRDQSLIPKNQRIFGCKEWNDKDFKEVFEAIYQANPEAKERFFAERLSRVIVDDIGDQYTPDIKAKLTILFKILELKLDPRDPEIAKKRPLVIFARKILFDAIPKAVFLNGTPKLNELKADLIKENNLEKIEEGLDFITEKGDIERLKAFFESTEEGKGREAINRAILRYAEIIGDKEILKGIDLENEGTPKKEPTVETAKESPKELTVETTKKGPYDDLLVLVEGDTDIEEILQKVNTALELNVPDKPAFSRNQKIMRGILDEINRPDKNADQKIKALREKLLGPNKKNLAHVLVELAEAYTTP